MHHHHHHRHHGIYVHFSAYSTAYATCWTCSHDERAYQFRAITLLALKQITAGPAVPYFQTWPEDDARTRTLHTIEPRIGGNIDGGKKNRLSGITAHHAPAEVLDTCQRPTVNTNKQPTNAWVENAALVRQARSPSYSLAINVFFQTQELVHLVRPPHGSAPVSYSIRRLRQASPFHGEAIPYRVKSRPYIAFRRALTSTAWHRFKPIVRSARVCILRVDVPFAGAARKRATGRFIDHSTLCGCWWARLEWGVPSTAEALSAAVGRVLAFLRLRRPPERCGGAIASARGRDGREWLAVSYGRVVWRLSRGDRGGGAIVGSFIRLLIHDGQRVEKAARRRLRREVSSAVAVPVHSSIPGVYVCIYTPRRFVAT